jgi:maleylacetoacetate isomerase
MKPILYHYWRSTSSWRVRWILDYKNIQVDYVPINLLNNESESPGFLRHNPIGHVPVLEIQTAHGPLNLTESTAIAEWLEETSSGPRLLPSNAFKRAQVRSLCELVNSGIQPLVNLTVGEKLSEDQEVRKQWNQHWITRGFRAYEKLIQATAGKFVLGDEMTLADIFLAPQCYAAERNDVRLEEFPLISKVYANLLETPSGQSSHPDRYRPN